MNELNNIVTATGQYNNIQTSLTSNTSVVNMIEGLTLTKEADKQNWSSGDLTYAITLTNNTDQTYSTPVIKTVINTSLVEFVKGSVAINDTPATESQYSYSSTLTMTLSDAGPSSTTTLTFRVTKKS